MSAKQPPNVPLLEPEPIDAVPIPGYRLLSILGAGGFGTVFRAVQESTGQIVAVKLLRPEAGLDERHLQRQMARFERETQLCAELSHPHIVKLLDKGQTEDGQLFAVFEFVPGETLKAFLARCGPLSALETGELMGQVLDALSSAHARGVVHRDLKPHNIMVSSTGVQVYAKVLDFGIGALIPGQRQADYKTLTMTQEVMGTPSYSAPEQLRGEPTTVKSDLYSWGLVFLECLTGQPAVRGQTLAEVYHQQLSAVDVTLPPPIAGHALASLLRRALRKDPRDRAAHAAQVYADFRQINLGTLVGDLSLGANTEAQANAQFSATLEHDGFGCVLQNERRQITVLCGSLNLKLARDIESDPEAMETLEALQRDQLSRISDIALRYGGYVTVELGGSVMIYFGYPHVSDTDARRAARTALELMEQVRRQNAALAAEQNALLEVRLGMHTGIVLTRPDRVPSGLTPNTASQIERLAPPGVVLVSDSTRQLLASHIEFEPFETMPSGNSDTPLAVFSMIGEKRAEAVSFLRDGERERPLVGRDSEWVVLHDMWAAAGRGEGGSVLITGEPGIGKSRLAYEMRRLADREGWVILDCRCLPEQQNNALYPILDMLKRRLRLQDDESALERLEVALESCQWPLEIAMPILCSWLALPLPKRFSPSQYSPSRQKQILLEVLEQLIVRWGDGQPFLLIVEDLHWSDPTGIEFLKRLVIAASGRSQLLLLTARTEFVSPWLPSELRRLELQRLAGEHTKELIQQVLGDCAIADDALTQLLDRADGIPLFAEELVRMLLDRGGLVERDGAYRLTQALDDGSIPITLRDMLSERLASLGTARETAQLAAAIGREFDGVLLAQASFRDGAEVQADLDQLIAADLAYRQRQVQGDRLMFRHALIRDAAYAGMPLAMREQAHARIAETLERRFAALVEANPAVTAEHFARARLFAKAVHHGTKAAKSSLQRSLNDETLSHASDVLAWIRQIDEADRAAAELDINGPLIQAEMGKYGRADPRVKARLDRSRELLGQSQDGQQVVPVLWSLALYHFVACNRPDLGIITDELWSIAEASDDLGLHVSARTIQGLRYHSAGEFIKSAEMLEQALELYDPEQHGNHGARFGLDSRSWAAGTLAMVSWFSGYSKTARRWADVSVAWARHLNHIPSLGNALLYRAIMHQHCGEKEAVREVAGELLQLSEQYALPGYSGYGMVMHCWATDNVSLAVEILHELRAMGCRLGLTYYGSLPADAEAHSGLLAAAVQRLSQCLVQCRENRELYYEAELYRRRALFLLHIYPAGNAAILDDLENSVALARARGMLRIEADALATLLDVFDDVQRKREHRLREILVLRPEMAAIDATVLDCNQV